MSIDSDPPELAEIERALCVTTERLTAELGTPSRTAPQWSDFEWQIAQAAAAMHGISPVLSHWLLWEGPASWQRFLQQQQDHTYRRHLRFESLLQELDTQARAAGIPFVPLKGVALHGLGVYVAGERPMADIDILVAERDREASMRLLQRLAYRESVSTWRNAVFETGETQQVGPFGEHCANPIKVELHCLVAERQPAFEKNISSCIWPDHPQPGANAYRSVPSLMTHLILHAFGSMCDAGLRAIQLHDIALLARRMSEDDWRQLLCGPAMAERWWLIPPLQCLLRYYPTSVPVEAVMQAQSHRPRFARWMDRSELISHVSLSCARVRAFPALCRAGSLEELCRYVGRRIRPEHDVVKVRRDNAIRHPGAARDRWAHLSQGRRILHWLVSRPARMETMSSVRAALSRTDAMT